MTPTRGRPNYAANPHLDQIKRSPAEAQHAVLITGCDENHTGTGQDWVVVRDPYPYERGHSPYAEAGYRFDAASGTVLLPWRALRERLNRTSVVFLEKRSV